MLEGALPAAAHHQLGAATGHAGRRRPVDAGARADAHRRRHRRHRSRRRRRDAALASRRRPVALTFTRWWTQYTFCFSSYRSSFVKTCNKSRTGRQPADWTNKNQSEDEVWRVARYFSSCIGVGSFQEDGWDGGGESGMAVSLVEKFLFAQLLAPMLFDALLADDVGQVLFGVPALDAAYSRAKMQKTHFNPMVSVLLKYEDIEKKWRPLNGESSDTEKEDGTVEIVVVEDVAQFGRHEHRRSKVLLHFEGDARRRPRRQPHLQTAPRVDVGRHVLPTRKWCGDGLRFNAAQTLVDRAEQISPQQKRGPPKTANTTRLKTSNVTQGCTKSWCPNLGSRGRCAKTFGLLH